MRWFTDEAREDDGDAWERAGAAYSAHLTAIAPRLPQDLARLAKDPRFDLDGGRFHEVHVDRRGGVVILSIDCGNLQVGYRRLTIRFDDAAIVPDDLQLVAYAIGAEFTPNHWHDGTTVTDIRAFEIDLVAPRRFTLRFRLWPFYEFAVEFGDLTMSEVPWPTRPPAHAGVFTSAVDRASTTRAGRSRRAADGS
jgi:hypothetical protein